MIVENSASVKDRRYLPQSKLPGWRQEALAAAEVLIIGAGGLGSPAALYLAAMGIGRLVLADPDTIAEENLHRQPLYSPETIGRPKVEVLSEVLLRLRPDLEVEYHTQWADEDFLRTIGAHADLWIDGTDNLQSRLAINSAAMTLRKPWVYGSIFQWEGQVALIEGISYVEIFGTGTEGPSCAEAGVLGALPGIIGSWQAALAAQYLSDRLSTPINRLFRIDLRTGDTHTFWLPAPSTPIPLELSFTQAQALPDAHWIDIRTDDATPLPISAERKSWYDWDTWELPPTPLILVCEAGNRSRQIAYALRKKTGRTDIFSLREGARIMYSMDE